MARDPLSTDCHWHGMARAAVGAAWVTFGVSGEAGVDNAFVQQSPLTAEGGGFEIEATDRLAAVSVLLHDDTDSVYVTLSPAVVAENDTSKAYLLTPAAPVLPLGLFGVGGPPKVYVYGAAGNPVVEVRVAGLKGAL